MKVCAVVLHVPLSICYKVHMMKYFVGFKLAHSMHVYLFLQDIISEFIF